MSANRLPDNFTELSLENQKTALEIAELQLPWWKKPKYLGILLPTIIGTATLILALFTNVINKQIIRYKSDLETLTEKENDQRLINDSLRKEQFLYEDSLGKLVSQLSIAHRMIRERDSISAAYERAKEQRDKEHQELLEAHQISLKDAKSSEEKIEILANQNNELQLRLRQISQSKLELASVLQDSIKFYRNRIEHIQLVGAINQDSANKQSKPTSNSTERVPSTYGLLGRLEMEEFLRTH